MYIPIDEIPQSVTNCVLNHFVGDVIDFDDEAEEAITRMLVKITKETYVKIEDFIKVVKGELL